MNKKFKNLMGLVAFFFLAVFSVNSASAYEATYDGTKSFRFDENLTSVTVTEGVTSISDGAFNFCTNLESIILPNSVRSIGNDAFRFCNNLTSVNIPNSVTSIGKLAFGVAEN